MRCKILIVDHEEKIRSVLYNFLTDEGFKVKVVSSGTEAFKVADSFKPDIMLIDQNMPGLNGIDVMEILKEKDPSLVVIIITAYGVISLAVKAIKKGAYDYIEKPFDNDKLLILLHRAMDYKMLTTKLNRLQDNLNDKYDFRNIISCSESMQKVLDMVKRVCNTDTTVLIQGESGVGKELIAQAIHHNSNRKNKSIIAVNCGAFPSQLIESELFGHEKWAFTDAKEMKIGKFEQAHEGTLFLDEIGELPLEAQVKLLRVLEERKIVRIGGSKSIQVNFRLIAATNKNLGAYTQPVIFRTDLLYRLNVFTIEIPPLRERKEDIPHLTDHFIIKYNNSLNKSIKSISEAAMELIMKYHWPGNIRDLENAIHSAMILTRGDVITKDCLPSRVFEYINVNNSFNSESDYKTIKENLEKEILINTLEKHNYNRTKAAKELNICRKTLFNKIKKYAISC